MQSTKQASPSTPAGKSIPSYRTVAPPVLKLSNHISHIGLGHIKRMNGERLSKVMEELEINERSREQSGQWELNSVDIRGHNYSRWKNRNDGRVIQDGMVNTRPGM